MVYSIQYSNAMQDANIVSLKYCNILVCAVIIGGAYIIIRLLAYQTIYILPFISNFAIYNCLI